MPGQTALPDAMSAMFSPGLGSWFGPDDHAAESDDSSPPLDLVPPNANGLLHVDDPVSESDDNMLPIFGHPLDPLRTPQPGTSRQCRRAPLRGPPRNDSVYDFPDENTPICQNILEAAPPKLTRKVHAKRRRPKKPTSSNKAVRQPYAARPRRNILSSVKVRQSCRLLPMAPLLMRTETAVPWQYTIGNLPPHRTDKLSGRTDGQADTPVAASAMRQPDILPERVLAEAPEIVRYLAELRAECTALRQKCPAAAAIKPHSKFFFR